MQRNLTTVIEPSKVISGRLNLRAAQMIVQLQNATEYYH